MTLLTMANEVASEAGFPSFASVYANTNDQMAQQIVALANRAGKALHRRHAWQKLIKEDFFQLPANATFAEIPPDFGRIIPDSMFDRTAVRKVDIPTNTSEWQRLKSAATWGSTIYARILDSEFVFYNVTGTASIYYEYVCANWVNTADENGKAAYSADTDVSLIDEDLITLEVMWRIKKAKGLPDWQIDQADAEREIRKVIGQEQSAKVLSLNPRKIGAELTSDRGFGA